MPPGEGADALPYRKWLSDRIVEGIVVEMQPNIEFSSVELWGTFSDREQQITEAAYPGRSGPGMISRTMGNILTAGRLSGLVRVGNSQGASARWVWRPPKDFMTPPRVVAYTTETPEPEVSEPEPLNDSQRRHAEAKQRTAEDKAARQRLIAEAGRDETITVGPVTEVGEPLPSRMPTDTEGLEVSIGHETTWQERAESLERAYNQLLADSEVLSDRIEEQIAEAVAEAERVWKEQDTGREGEPKVGQTYTYECIGYLTDGTALFRNEDGFLGDVRFDAL
jgi:hypothetical protein